MRTNPSPEIPSLTGLRFFAAFMVAIAHSMVRFRLSGTDIGYWITQTAGLGMTLFFVLSGFVIHYNYRILLRKGPVDGVAEFLWARFARLYPLFLLFLVIDVMSGHELRASIIGRAPTPAMTDMLNALPYYFLFMHSWFYIPGAEHSLIYEFGGVVQLTWSISTEWFFYIAYPLISLILTRIKRQSTAILGAVIWSILWVTVVIIVISRIELIESWSVDRYGPIASIATGFQDSFYRWLLYFSPYLRVGEFVLGCLVAHIYVVLQHRIPSRIETCIGGVLLIFGWLSLGLIFYLMYVPNGTLNYVRQLALNFGLAPSVATIIFCAARYRSPFSAMVSWRPFVALGEASYSIYLLHVVVLSLTARYVVTVPSTGREMALILVRLSFSLCLVLVLALELQYFIEAPTRRWLRGLWSYRQFGQAN